MARRPRGTSVSQTIGGLLVGFDEQVWSRRPPAQERVEKTQRLGTVVVPGGLTVELPAPLDIAPLDPSPPELPAPATGAGGRPPLVTLGAVLLAYLVVVNVVTFVAYALDKRAARSGDRRTPERTLFALNLAGGFVGGWLGMYLLRHKTRHSSFKVVQTLATLAWVGLLVLLLRNGLIP